jgi:hypothetical protein
MKNLLAGNKKGRTCKKSKNTTFDGIINSIMKMVSVCVDVRLMLVQSPISEVNNNKWLYSLLLTKKILCLCHIVKLTNLVYILLMLLHIHYHKEVQW